MTPIPAVSIDDPAVVAFLIIPLGLLGALLAGTHRASLWLRETAATRRRALLVTILGASAWMGGTWWAAERGLFRMWDATPPPFLLLLLGIVSLSLAIGCTPYGRRLARGVPLWALVGIQGFRLPLELAMHAMYTRGIMPE
jgi:hypothetical protein